jgi:hypothetical protein
MIVVMKAGANAKEVSAVIARVKKLGYDAHLSDGEERTIIGIVGNGNIREHREQFEMMEGVERTMPVSHPYKLASREFHATNTLVPLNSNKVGAEKIVVIAGPCSVESREQILETAHAVKEAGATALRGGAFKPRTSPYAFQGMGEEGLKYLAEAREQTGLPIVTEVMEPAMVPMVCDYADVLQIGARNMNEQHNRRVADGCRIHPEPWQYASDALRTGHPHLRAVHPQHVRHQRYPGTQGTNTPARHRRSQPRHWLLPVCRSRGQSCRRCRGGWDHR